MSALWARNNRRQMLVGHPMRTATLLATCLAMTACSGGDAPIPPGYGALVESARSSVLDNHEGLFKPGLAVTRVTCFPDGGVVILFRQIGGPTPGEPAFAMGGVPGPAPDAYSWSGGWGDMEEINAEIEFNYGDVREVLCPPRAP